MKWKIVASPTKGQSSECQSSQPAAIASGKLKRIANLALDNGARVQPSGRGPFEPPPPEPCVWLTNRSFILQRVDDRPRLQTDDPKVTATEPFRASCSLDGCNVLAAARFQVRVIAARVQWDSCRSCSWRSPNPTVSYSFLGCYHEASAH